MMCSVLEQRDLARSQCDDGPLSVGLLAHAVGAAGAFALALAVESIDLQHLDAPDAFDRIADLRLGS